MPGDKLPTYDELEELFKVSRITLQQVVTHLKRDGYLESVARQGLFVSRKPPFLNRVGLVIPRDETRMRFWRELINSARAMADLLGKELVIYRNLTNSDEVEKQLIHDTANKLLAGIFFAYAPVPEDRGYSVYTDPSVLKVVSRIGGIPPGLSIPYTLNELQLASRALDYLQEEGCRRIALIANIGNNPTLAAYLDEIKKRGLYSPRKWCFQIATENLEIAENIVQILMDLPPDERPRGIFICDDNFTAAVAKGLAATNVRIPEELSIAAHYNWSSGPAEYLPAKCLGFDLNSLMLKSFRAFDEYYATGKLVKKIEESVYFENELNNHEKIPKGN